MTTQDDNTEIAAQTTALATADKGQMFSFGDPESVIDGRDLMSYFEIYRTTDWYEPPVPMDMLARSLHISPHHRSAISVKVNLLIKHQIPTPEFSRAAFENWALDFLQMGNGYAERIDNRLGRVVSIAHSPALHTRVGIDDDIHWWIQRSNDHRSNDQRGLTGGYHEYGAGKIFHLRQPEPLQEIYGIPEWLSALQSVLLNENATLFRRRYYKNGNHAGFVFYVSEPLVDMETNKNMQKRLEGAKGVGNFRNMFVHIPNGKKDGIQIIPIADVMAKDEFFNIKNITRDDILHAHRVPPQLIAIIPQNNGGFGDVGKATDIFFGNEIEPIMMRMLAINDWAGREVLRFKEYVKASG